MKLNVYERWIAFLSFVALVLWAASCAAQAQSATVVASCGAASYTVGQQYPLQMLANGTLCTNATLSGSVTVGNATITAPLGVQTQAASVATTVNGALPSGGNLLGKVGIDQTTPGMTNGVQTLSGSVTSLSSATHIQTAALAANQIITASAHSLTSFEVSADSTLSGAAWWIMIYDATSAPSDGAVTPAKCYALPSGATSFNGAFNQPPAFTAGIVIGVSTTGCFTKTASAHAFISGDYQ